MEVLNGRGSEAENAFALEISKRFNLKATGASDAHRREDIGTFATEFQRPILTLEGLIYELKSGNFGPVLLEGRRGAAHTA